MMGDITIVHQTTENYAVFLIAGVQWRSNAIRRPWIFARNAALNIVIKTDLNSK